MWFATPERLRSLSAEYLYGITSVGSRRARMTDCVLTTQGPRDTRAEARVPPSTFTQCPISFLHTPLLSIVYPSVYTHLSYCTWLLSFYKIIIHAHLMPAQQRPTSITSLSLYIYHTKNTLLNPTRAVLTCAKSYNQPPTASSNFDSFCWFFSFFQNV